MALTHHFIVQASAYRANPLRVTQFRDYALLGDDIVIANSDVALKYKEILKELDMPISDAKTHVSLDTYEFAKRWIYKGSEITPFSLHGLLETWKSYSLFENFYETQLRHGWVTEASGPAVLTIVMEFFGKRGQALRTAKLYNIFHLLQMFLKKETTIEDKVSCVDEISRLTAYPVPEGLDKIAFLDDLIHAFLLQKMKMEKDTIVKNHQAFVTKYLTTLRESNPGLSTQTILIPLRNLHPFVNVCTFSLEKVANTYERLIKGDSEDLREIVFSRELSGAALSIDVFSIRKSKAIILAKSMITKNIMNSWRRHLDENLGTVPIIPIEPLLFKELDKEVPMPGEKIVD